MLANYDLIKHDFPETRNLTVAEIDIWLIRNAAFISKEQALQTVVNTTILVSELERLGFRPREYRRGHVFVTDGGALIDAKGSGSVDPAHGHHSNGLATLSEMIREFLYEQLIHKIFHKVGRFDTVRNYAVIDYGFDIKHQDGTTSRAGSILRQAHERYHDDPVGPRARSQAAMLPRNLQVDIELLLRKFGISSAIHWKDVHMINLQGTPSGAVVDFGAFLTHPNFYLPLHFYYDTSGVAGQAEMITAPGKDSFVHPSSYRIPFEIWGFNQSGQANPVYDNPALDSYRLAKDWTEGKINQQSLIEYVTKHFFDPVDKILDSIPASLQLSLPVMCSKMIVD